MKDKEVRKELTEIAPGLNNLSKEEAYVIPDTYFDHLSDKVWSKIAASDDIEQKSNIIPIAKRILAIAASIAVLFFVSGEINIQNKNVEEIPLETLVDFVMEDVSDLDEVFLSEMYDEAFDLAESEDATFEFIQEEGLEDIDDQFLQTLY